MQKLKLKLKHVEPKNFRMKLSENNTTPALRPSLPPPINRIRNKAQKKIKKDVLVP